MLVVDALRVSYGPIEAVHGVGLRVDAGEVVSLVGPNGAGKSSTLNAIAAVIRPAAGSIELDGQDVTRRSPEKMAAAGIGTVPEGRRIFASLTVRENLAVALAACGDRRAGRERIEGLLDRFAILRTFEHRQAALLSGGQQQMLAIARALVHNPRLLLLDEPSLGLAPLMVDELFELLGDLRDEGVTMLLVEQNASRAIEFADRSYVIRSGSIVESGTRQDFAGSNLATLLLGSDRDPAPIEVAP
jgi:branched-chain amino acid transport system ATP-binding protein